MQVESSKEAARAWVRGQTGGGRTVGLVPTMGALHEGHLSLVRHSRQRCDATVVTIFVNPTQFGPGEDLSRYPRTLDADLQMLREAAVDLVFVPEARTVYPEGFSTYVAPPDIARSLEGESRPDHFRGVATVVLKLFHILPATHAFFGQKDYQQARVLQTMAADLDLDMAIEICPTVREADGLALSSRNRYLSGDERLKALGLWRALRTAESLVNQGQRDPQPIEAAMRRVLQESGVTRIDYAAVVDRRTLSRMTRIDAPAVALVAARVGDTRLIDNHLLSVE